MKKIIMIIIAMVIGTSTFGFSIQGDRIQWDKPEEKELARYLIYTFAYNTEFVTTDDEKDKLIGDLEWSLLNKKCLTTYMDYLAAYFIYGSIITYDCYDHFENLLNPKPDLNDVFSELLQ